MNLVTVGPIDLTTQSNFPMYTNTIISDRQKLFSSIRFSPQLLCVKSPILAETARESERAILFNQDDDYITFFQACIYLSIQISNSNSDSKVH